MNTLSLIEDQDYKWKIVCPICGDDYVKVAEFKNNAGGDYENSSSWLVRGDVLAIKFEAECGHIWETGLCFHKGQTFLMSHNLSRLDYYEYIKSDEWKARADAAKERAGHRCQVCNKTGRLDAHHRTYERLGEELPEDITVLCHDCHELYETNRKSRKAQR